MFVEFVFVWNHEWNDRAYDPPWRRTRAIFEADVPPTARRATRGWWQRVRAVASATLSFLAENDSTDSKITL